MATVADGPSDDRARPRDDVHCRARAFGPDAKPLSLLIVNLSARGLMARGVTPYAVGERVRVRLPVIGVVVAEIRWSIGERIGFELEQEIGPADYYEILAAMLRRR